MKSQHARFFEVSKRMNEGSMKYGAFKGENEQCESWFTDIGQSIIILLLSAVFYMAFVIFLEKWREMRIKQCENSKYKLQENSVQEAIKESKDEKGILNLSTRDIIKVYKGKVEAVKRVNLDLHANEILGLLGPNGAGKSSTFNMVTL